MNILLADNGKIPALKYGGTERVIWYLGKELKKRGHNVTFLCAPGSDCDFATIIERDNTLPLLTQIPDDTDIMHFNYPASDLPDIPVIFTNHGNRNSTEPFHKNTVFVSESHAGRYGSDCFVHNGLDWSDYGPVTLDNRRSYFHFLGNAAWKVKNLKGAIETVLSLPNAKLAVMGGHRINFRMGFRVTFSPRISFHGMVGGKKKSELLQNSNGLIFPVRWHEPFGLAIIESMYYGCPVFGTPYGSLPELVPAECGSLHHSSEELAEAIMTFPISKSRRICHEYALKNFNASEMADKYLKLYVKILAGQSLNQVEPSLKEPVSGLLPWN